MKYMQSIRKIYFVGIGGIGMSGIAEVLHNLGYYVAGSDLNRSSITRRLQKIGIMLFQNHSAEQVDGADVVVVSSAIDGSNPELQYAKAKRIPVVRRAEMLAELMRLRFGIAVAGTHGKTTTTSLISHIFSQAGKDPTFVIGGRIKQLNKTAHLGKSQYFIAEADESDASFLHLSPMMAIITNIDADHMETYDYDFAKMQQAYIDFVHRLPFYGQVIICGDDAGLKAITDRLERPVLTYGFSDHVDFKIESYQTAGLNSQFTLNHQGQSNQYQIALAGKHNVLNATAAIIAALHQSISTVDIDSALMQFEGIDRRLQVHGLLSGPAFERVLLVDDYGHHPTELMATTDALLNAFPDKPIYMVFQPHRYSRTKLLYDDFVEALIRVKQTILLDVYAAGEKAIPFADSQSLANSMRVRGVEPIYLKQNENLLSILSTTLVDDAILVMQGAGDIHYLTQQLMQSSIFTIEVYE